MSPNIGRPTEEPKRQRLELRLSEGDAAKIKFCCEALGMTKAEVIRRGIDKVYLEAQKK